MTNACGKSLIGVIGIGHMGSGIALRLLEHGFRLKAYDLSAQRLAPIASAGAEVTESAGQVVEQCDCVLTSLPSSKVFVEVADSVLIPSSRAGQTFIDFGTTTVGETRRIADELRAKGAFLLDTPVSGNPRTAGLRIFVGGDRAEMDRWISIFHALTEPSCVTYCGPSGNGQVVKGVNQLAMGLASAAYMEAVSFGVASGINPQVLEAAVGGDAGFRREVAQVAQLARQGAAEGLDAKLAELDYFIEHAEQSGFAVPLTQSLKAFCSTGEPRWRDNMSRPYVSFWHQLMERAQKTGR